MALTVMTVPVFARVGTTEIQIGTITVDLADVSSEPALKITDDGMRMTREHAAAVTDVPDSWAFGTGKRA